MKSPRTALLLSIHYTLTYPCGAVVVIKKYFFPESVGTDSGPYIMACIDICCDPKLDLLPQLLFFAPFARTLFIDAFSIGLLRLCCIIHRVSLFDNQHVGVCHSSVP